MRTVSFLGGVAAASPTLGRAGKVILTVSFFGSLSLIRRGLEFYVRVWSPRGN